MLLSHTINNLPLPRIFCLEKGDNHWKIFLFFLQLDLGPPASRFDFSSSQYDQRLQLPDAARSRHHIHWPALRGVPGTPAGAQPVARHPHHHPGSGRRRARRLCQWESWLQQTQRSHHRWGTTYLCSQAHVQSNVFHLTWTSCRTLFSPAGDLLIILAQIIVAVQMVLEEKFVYKHDVHPLRAVGTEGVYTPCQTCKGKTVTLSSLSAVYRSTRFYLWLFNHKSHFYKRSLSKDGRRGYSNTRMKGRTFMSLLEIQIMLSNIIMLSFSICIFQYIHKRKSKL